MTDIFNIELSMLFRSCLNSVSYFRQNVDNDLAKNKITCQFFTIKSRLLAGTTPRRFVILIWNAYPRILSSQSSILVTLSNDRQQWCICIKHRPWGQPTDISGPKTSPLLEVRLYTDVNGATVGASLCTNVPVLCYINGGTASTVMAIVRTKPTVWRRASPPNPPMLAPYSTTAHIYSSLRPPLLPYPHQAVPCLSLLLIGISIGTSHSLGRKVGVLNQLQPSKRFGSGAL